MKRPTAVTTKTTTSRAVRLSIAFVVATATTVALLGLATMVSRLVRS